MQAILSNLSWFQGFDSIIEIVSLLTAIFVAYYSFRVFRYTDMNKYRIMSLAFLFIALSFGIKVFTDIGVRAHVAQIGGIQTFQHVLDLSATLQSGYLAMRLFMLLGLVLFLKLTFNIENNRLLLLLGFFSIMITFSSYSAYYAFHIAAAVMLGFIVEFLWCNYKKKNSMPAGMVFTAFVLLFLSQLCFVFVSKSEMIYPMGEVLQLGGFITFIVNHIMMLKK